MIETFLKNVEDKRLYYDYVKRKEDNKAWNINKKHKKATIGALVDIRSPEFVWCVGVVKKIIFRGEKQKRYLVITYKDLPAIYNEEIMESSNRLACEGFFTKRMDIPKLSFDEMGRKRITLLGKDLDFNFIEKLKKGNSKKKLVETDSSYVSESDEEEEEEAEEQQT